MLTTPTYSLSDLRFNVRVNRKYVVTPTGAWRFVSGADVRRMHAARPAKIELTTGVKVEPLPAKTVSAPAAGELDAILAAYEAAEELQDYPGRYFPALNAVHRRMKAWGDAHPERLRAAAKDRKIPRWLLETHGWGSLWSPPPELAWKSDPNSHYSRALAWTD